MAMRWIIEIEYEGQEDLAAHLRTILRYIEDEVPIGDWSAGKGGKWLRRVTALAAAAPASSDGAADTRETE